MHVSGNEVKMNSGVRLSAAPAASSFSKYGKSFQEKIFQGMATDKDWATQMHEVMSPDYFDLKYLQYLTGKYFEYYDDYRCFPTMQLLIQIIREVVGIIENAFKSLKDH